MRLISKIMAIDDIEILLALEQLIVSNARHAADLHELTDLQRHVLDKSEADIANGDTISQEVMNQRNREWLSKR